jgi:enoyl-CoA hydratase/carnithine racemase
VASADARFGQPEVRDGSFVSSIVPWLTTSQRAKQLMLTGDTFPARQAHELGLVSEVVAEGQALAAAEKARRLSHVPVPTARSVKRYVGFVQELQGLLAAQRYGNVLAATLRTLRPEEMGTQDLVRLLETGGLKAYIAARDAPFARD